MMHDELAHSALGRTSAISAGYDAGLLFAVPRAPARAALGLASDQPLPFIGQDVWTAYELSWLDARGKPCSAMAELSIPSNSRCLVESKSLKLYLNGFNAERMDSADVLRARIVEDLTRATEAAIGFDFIESSAPRNSEPVGSLDELDVDIDRYGPPTPESLSSDNGDVIEETLTTEAFKSNCPVTGQPDFASVWIRYRGLRIDRAPLLRYLVSYREHAALHEQCVERIFCDVAARCAPEALAVCARFTRRGGLDINPQRATNDYRVEWPGRTSRQ